MVKRRNKKRGIQTAVQMWGILDPHTGKIWKYTACIRDRRAEAQKAFADGTEQTWREWYLEGWRAVKVTVQEVY